MAQAVQEAVGNRNLAFFPILRNKSQLWLCLHPNNVITEVNVGPRYVHYLAFAKTSHPEEFKEYSLPRVALGEKRFDLLTGVDLRFRFRVSWPVALAVNLVIPFALSIETTTCTLVQIVRRARPLSDKKPMKLVTSDRSTLQSGFSRHDWRKSSRAVLYWLYVFGLWCWRVSSRNSRQAQPGSLRSACLRRRFRFRAPGSENLRFALCNGKRLAWILAH